MKDMEKLELLKQKAMDFVELAREMYGSKSSVNIYSRCGYVTIEAVRWNKAASSPEETHRYMLSIHRQDDEDWSIDVSDSMNEYLAEIGKLLEEEEA